MLACIHCPYCSSSIMKRMNSFAAFRYLVYLKIIWFRNRWNAVLPAGPAGYFECWMSAASALIFGSLEFLAAKYTEIPLLVIEIWPSRNTLLLLGSSHDSVPGMKVEYISFEYSSAFSVSGLSIVTLPDLSTIFPPKAQTSQWHQVLASPVAWPSAKPPGVPLACSAFSIFRKPSVSFGTPSKPAAFSWLSRYTIMLPAAPSGMPIQFLPVGRR